MAQVYEDPVRQYCDPPELKWRRKYFIDDASCAIECLRYYHSMLTNLDDVVCPKNDKDVEDLLYLMQWYGKHNFQVLLSKGMHRNDLRDLELPGPSPLRSGGTEVDEINDDPSTNDEHPSKDDNKVAIDDGRMCPEDNSDDDYDNEVPDKLKRIYTDLQRHLENFQRDLDTALQKQGLATHLSCNSRISALPVWDLFMRCCLKSRPWTTLGQGVQQLQSLPIAGLFSSGKGEVAAGMPLVTSIKLLKTPIGRLFVFVGTTAEYWCKGHWLELWYVRKRAGILNSDERQRYAKLQSRYVKGFKAARGAGSSYRKRHTSKADAMKKATENFIAQTRKDRERKDEFEANSLEIALEFPGLQRKEACNRCYALLCHPFLEDGQCLEGPKSLQELMDKDGFLELYPDPACAEFLTDAFYRRFRLSAGYSLA